MVIHQRFYSNVVSVSADLGREGSTPDRVTHGTSPVSFAQRAAVGAAPGSTSRAHYRWLLAREAARHSVPYSHISKNFLNE